MIEARIAALDAKIDALRAERVRLKKKAEERRAKHQSTAELEHNLRGLTMQQLRAELSVTRRRYFRHGYSKRTSPTAVKCRERAEVIASTIEQRQQESP